MNNRTILIYVFKIMPKGFISRIFGFLTRIRFPKFFLNYVIKKYCEGYKVNTEEINYPGKGFRTLDDFFTRKLKQGVHQVDSGRNSIVSPVDGRIDQFGKIDGNRIIQAKGIDYTVNALVPSDTAQRFIDGHFITLYLSPADYHRIHSPADGKITGYFAVPGKLFTVQEFLVNGIKGLFTKNERLISYIENRNTLFAVCKIGAMNVGRITLSYSGIVTNRFFRKREELFFKKDSQSDISRGDELGVFHLGSTIILLFQKDTVKFAEIETGQKVRMGQRIASFV
ncbi:MAG: phosphatidylserine decarboxylase [Spirochaetes bacterium]|nr:phosphatidylserine decarboxylase [Spirochaetota bacterium]